MRTSPRVPPLLLAIAAWLAAAVAFPASARAGDETLCAQAIGRAEAAEGIPRGLLGAVALSESGRREARGAPFTPWPWTVNNAGDGRYFGSKAEALAWVGELRAQGRRNIDVGCMQVNLMHHPDAFAGVEAALDPRSNVAYGARFLAGLREATGSWARAVERYHTAEPVRGQAYRDRVYAHWDGLRLGRTAGMRQPSRAGALLAAWTDDDGPTRPRVLPTVFGNTRAVATAGGAGQGRPGRIATAAAPARRASAKTLAPTDTVRAAGRAGPVAVAGAAEVTRPAVPARFFPVVFGPRPVVAAASAPPRAGSRPGRPAPAVLGSTRSAPGFFSLQRTHPSTVARGPAPVRRPVPPREPGGKGAAAARAGGPELGLGPALGRIAFLTGGPVAATAGPPTGSGSRAAGDGAGPRPSPPPSAGQPAAGSPRTGRKGPA